MESKYGRLSYGIAFKYDFSGSDDDFLGFYNELYYSC
jgi:hypothetical protein